MHLCLTVECITSGLHLSVLELGHPPPPRSKLTHSHRVEILFPSGSAPHRNVRAHLEQVSTVYHALPCDLGITRPVRTYHNTRLSQVNDDCAEQEVTGQCWLNGSAFPARLTPNAQALVPHHTR